MTERRCYTPEEFARSRKVSVRTVYRQIKAGKIHAERIGAQWRIWMVDPRHRTARDNHANN